ncbi:hypothetical protein G6O69_24820 [Pseudenhygromyxa sp. WMMC2535]|uniref:hypothetical protein n=1 Tax=Pseudenhygromyxa sp. WMMC2535 TaxID=2712867 RepID=UPI0015557FC1|nr:hypothetical protein [Pseudenhygromyxa sp. WMMC2535]NVB41086.1 hypothetical protein [Pseudenhygromyxa sp. WMMC2535]
MPRITLVPALSLITLTLACTPDGDTQPDNLGSDAEGSYECVETATVLSSIDEVSALGFSAADVLAVAAGEHSSPMTWVDQIQDGLVEIEVGPESGESTIDLSLTHEGGEIRYIDSEPAESDYEIDIDCNDRLEIDVVAEVETGGGALAETLSVVLKAENIIQPYFQTALDLDALAGSMTVTTETPDLTIGAPSLQVGISSFGLNGTLTGMVELVSGNAVAAGFVEYASFPGGSNDCEFGDLSIPLDHALQGFSAADALALINDDWGLEIIWEEQSATALSLSAAHDGEAICAVVGSGEGEAGSLRFGAVLTLTGTDLDATIPVEVVATADEMGALANVSVYSDIYSSLVDAPDFADTYGEFGVDVSGYDLAGVEFSGAFAPSDVPGSADGSLAVLGAMNPDCSDVPGEPCEGIDTEELARATWANP